MSEDFSVKNFEFMQKHDLLKEIKRIEEILIILTKEIDRGDATHIWLKGDYLNYLKQANDILKKQPTY